MIIAVISIIVITGIAWGISQLLPYKICPVCAGVSGTWLVLGALMLAGRLPEATYLLPIAILMGGSVVGIGYQGEKSYRWPAQNPVIWKLIVMSIGFPLVYNVVLRLNWSVWFGELIALCLLMYAFFVRKAKPEPHTPHRSDDSDVQKIEKGLEKCC
ncbi:hypothetical protein A3B21_03780 [Candidatus Uhrbacteria bacterium RIFCSPLOWO2_01_FULL_47_24]|uniref:Uncharacterized protein n=1 Tax=Candidatus Uhrbacteria bacterium RIFCSPLOWO2_01_FULL_47_24 TaxID=1802401 RepID=A0A1F7URI3_9BACT|nr:MAG: hypothetical protein A2753_01505 [Candidatus Uhrbacteria bacterium RIFCSPHIGHO2_01_FULL_47_11]OGL68551.1 MAG: hypothetical protein A3D58_02380 [Candidatus Uhrbacteria bacterium RIFCSPHIGHO2_02_FULL_46_47]OGL75488.1 MAG: hypothetical protein A3F52_04255 [Candidatus Uhrbacteria bacterium RIFCSPHIGHO2_12_FULL_47_11]OGL80859.1 MAG: hypothetical protein A3B21_03780 [Candidatus Uhrbacteria bacterium RIFCSPLOWO2_01_FULL_47_24]OGL84757.1 MAG: hypothetical protein A3J03_01135 [Candidatus Uhrbact